MTIFNLITAAITLVHPGLSERNIKPEITHATDSLQIIEKVYIHTDRNLYYPGDDIWFKAYLIDASDRSLSGQIGNLHVELISPASNIIISRVIRLEGGLGNGDFQLPENLKSGRYRIRAYTNYMRNFGDQLFFNREIVVINSKDTINNIENDIQFVNNKTDLRFFPEGGSLVDNVPSLVAFKAVDAAGKGTDLSGEIFSSEGELITTFKSDHLGMGSFIFRPLPETSYYAIAKDSSGVVIKSDLPKSFQSGVTLSASFNKNNELVITTRTNPETLPLLLDNDLLLSFSARKVHLKTVSFRIKSYTNSFTLPIDDLPDGIVMMTLSARDSLPLSERLIYIQKNKDFEITLEPGKPVYKQRDSVSIRLSSSSDSESGQVAFLSLSAVEKKFTDNSTQYPTTISSWFMLESDIRGTIEEPSYYFDQSNPNRLHDLDLLLLTQGWRDFEWKYNSTNYYPPEVGFTVSGRLRKLIADKPIEVPKVNIGIFENEGSLVTTVPVNSSGQFCLDSIDLTGDARLLVSSVNRKGNPQGMILLDSLKYQPEVIDNQSHVIVLREENFTTFKQEHEIKESILKKYKLSDTINLGEVTIIARKPVKLESMKVESTRMLFGKPENEVINAPQFAGYKNIFELLRGRVAGVRVDGNVIRIRGINSIGLTNMPLVLIDGIQKPYDDLASFPISFIDRIDIYKSAGEIGFFGSRGANGVISIITKSGDILLPDKLVYHTVNKKISGYSEARVFYSPQHLTSSAAATGPDFRTTLFWKPNIRLQSNRYQFIKFFNADNSATIRVRAEGITNTGIPVTGETEYEVR
jgi:hypothetical protein